MYGLLWLASLQPRENYSNLKGDGTLRQKKEHSCLGCINFIKHLPCCPNNFSSVSPVPGENDDSGPKPALCEEVLKGINKEGAWTDNWLPVFSSPN